MQHWLEPITLAYLDPGTGSYALQLLMAGIFGGMFALRHSWAEFRAWASSRVRAGRAGDSPSPTRGPISSRISEAAKVSHHARTSSPTR